MKRKSVMLFFGIFIALLFLQLSNAGGKEDQDDQGLSNLSDQAQAAQGTSTEVKETSVAEVLLADTHKAAGVECKDCHKETPPASETPTDVCLICHEDYKERAASSVDPHNAHTEFSNCGDCHHSHRTSENQCLACHSFNLKAP